MNGKRTSHKPDLTAKIVSIRHGNSCPDMCSQCAGYADVKRVVLDEKHHVLRIDGKVVRQGQETPWYPRKRRKA